jgi:hypothetical protein
VPFQGAFFFRDGFPMALPWAEGDVPLAGRQTAKHPENSYVWYEAKSDPCLKLFCPAGASHSQPMATPWADQHRKIRPARAPQNGPGRSLRRHRYGEPLRGEKSSKIGLDLVSCDVKRLHSL